MWIGKHTWQMKNCTVTFLKLQQKSKARRLTFAGHCKRAEGCIVSKLGHVATNTRCKIQRTPQEDLGRSTRRWNRLCSQWSWKQHEGQTSFLASHHQCPTARVDGGEWVMYISLLLMGFPDQQKSWPVPLSQFCCEI